MGDRFHASLPEASWFAEQKKRRAEARFYPEDIWGRMSPPPERNKEVLALATDVPQAPGQSNVSDDDDDESGSDSDQEKILARKWKTDEIEAQHEKHGYDLSKDAKTSGRKKDGVAHKGKNKKRRRKSEDDASDKEGKKKKRNRSPSTKKGRRKEKVKKKKAEAEEKGPQLDTEWVLDWRIKTQVKYDPSLHQVSSQQADKDDEEDGPQPAWEEQALLNA